MTAPRSDFLPGAPRLHFLEWNPRGRVCVVLLHGSSANAWWWEWVADALAGQEEIRLVAVDLRGHGDSEWVRPPAYKPGEYADDVARFIDGLGLTRPVVAGHSMGGIVALTFALRYPQTARAIIAIDVAITSTARRDRYLRHLKSLPTIVYPDLETARSRFRLMPNEGEIPASTLARIAENSLERTEDGRYTMKFARESFFGGDGLDVAEAIKAVTVPTLLVRAEKSRIMTAEAAVRAADSNPMVQLTEIPGAHHHLPLERPGEMAAVIEAFVREIQ